MYGVGVVGCGVIGTRLAETVADHGETEIAACCDLDEDRAESFGESFDCTAYTAHEDLVSDSAVDIVYVGVPPVAHQPVVEAALEADRHVLCEKPIAPDGDTGQALVEAAADTQTVTAINLPFRYTPGFRDLVDAVSDGALGDIGRVELRFRFPQWPREWQAVDWLETREQGGPLREVGTHFLFGVQELFGSIEQVTASVRRPDPERYEESIVGHFSVDGIDGTIDLLCDHEGQEENTISVVGTERQYTLVEWYKLVEAYNQPDERVHNERRANTIELLLDEFVTEIEGGDGNLVSFETANQVQRVIDAVFSSDGQPVDPRS